MNIVFLSREFPPAHNGGVGIYTYEMSKLLSENGHRVFVITEAIETPLQYLHHGVTIFRVLPEKQSFFDCIRRYVPGFVDRLEYSRAVSRTLKTIFSQCPIDVVESCEARAEAFWFYLWRNKPALVIKLHTPEGIVYKLNREPRSKDRYCVEKLEEWWLHKARKLVGLSNAIVSLTCSHYGLRCAGIPLVPNPLDIATFIPVYKTHPYPLVLYVGRLEFRKGCHVLIRSIPLILRSVPQARFLFVGNDCGMYEYLSKKVSVLGISEHVDFVGHKSREVLIDHYNRCSVCCVPSLWENQPYTCLEAMACGKPVIASRIGGIPEIIQDGINGLLVTPGSAIDLAASVVKVLQDKQFADRIGEHARKTMESRYNLEDVMKKNIAVYKQVLQ